MFLPMSTDLSLDLTALERARLSRDARFDGKFFIAVKTTGIYCRPICPSPTSKSRNVRYYATAAAAAEAGFRPCLRCRPEAAPGTPAWLGTSAVVQRALRLIEEGILDSGSVDDLAGRLGLGARHLRRLFLQHVGASPISFAQTRRLQFAKRLLDETNLTITEIGLAAGFGSVRRFNTAFRQAYGRAPRELRKHSDSAADADGGVILKLAYRPPYDWNQVRDFLAANAIPGVEHVDEGSYSRTLKTDAGFSIICVRPIEGENALELRVQGVVSSSLFQIASAARRVFDTSADPALTTFVLRSDPLLGPYVEQRPGLRIPGEWDPFECTVCAVLASKAGVASVRTLVGSIVERAGGRIKNCAQDLTSLFPTPAALAKADLEGLGLSRTRIAALQEVSRAVLQKKLDFNASTNSILEVLSQLPGVGSSIAEYVALRALGEPDAFPANDSDLRRLAGIAERPLSALELEARAEAWRPWRGYAAMHLWRTTMDQVARRAQ